MASVDCSNLTGNMLGNVVSCIQSMTNEALLARQNILVPEGQDLAAVFLMITVSLAMVDMVLSSDGAQALAATISGLMRYFLVVVLLAGWSSSVGDFFNANMNAVAQKVAGTDSVGTSMNLMYQAVVSLISPEESVENCHTLDTPGIANEFPAVICDTPPGTKADSPSFLDFVVAIPKAILKIIMKAITIVFLLLMMITYVLAIVMAQALFGIGMCLGPILIPGLVWQRTEFLFDGFLRFMLSAAMVKIVAALMVAVVTGIILVLGSLSKLVDTTGVINRIDLVAAFMVALVAGVGAYMMSKVEGIAQSLLSGGGGGASGGGSVRSGRLLTRSITNTLTSLARSAPKSGGGGGARP